MSFAQPAVLWGLLLIPLAFVLYVVNQSRRGQVARRFASPGLLPNLAPRGPGWRRHVPAMLYLLALGALLVSLARPQTMVPVRREQSTVVLLMDTSISMIATDVQPNRLQAAQAAGRRFLEILPTPVRVGVVSFSNSVDVLTRPTDDRQAVLAALDTLRAGGGTAMGDALNQAIDVAQTASAAEAANATPTSAPAPARPGAPATTPATRPAAVLLLSDGAQTAGQADPLVAAGRAQQLGIPIYTIALGTQSGSIESPDAPGTGQRLAVPPDEATLRRVAELTGGRFFTAPSAAELHAVYQGLASSVSVVQEPREVTAAFAGAGAALVVVGGVLGLLWFNRFA
jgi:Ca-activated chloride channel family protein